MLYTVPADVNWQLAQDCEWYHHTGRQNIPLKSVICMKNIFEDLMSVVVQRRISSVSWWPFFKQKTTLIVSSQKISPLRISYNLFDCSHPFPPTSLWSFFFLYSTSFGCLYIFFKPMKSHLCCSYTLECVVFHWSILNLPLQNTDPPSPRFYQLPVSPYLGVELMPHPSPPWDRVHTVISTMVSHVWLPCCGWEALLPVFTHHLWLSTLSHCLLQKSLSWERGGVIQVPRLRLNILPSLIVCIPIISKIQ